MLWCGVVWCVRIGTMIFSGWRHLCASELVASGKNCHTPGLPYTQSGTFPMAFGFYQVSVQSAHCMHKHWTRRALGIFCSQQSEHQTWIYRPANDTTLLHSWCSYFNSICYRGLPSVLRSALARYFAVCHLLLEHNHLRKYPRSQCIL